MKKPNSMEGMFGFIYFWLGLSFALMGGLTYMGVIKPKSSSMVQEPALLGIIFFSIGGVFLLAQAVLMVIVFRRNKLHEELLANGTRIQGIVEKVYLQRYTSYGNQSPYRIVYRFNWEGKSCQKKSCLLWEKPEYKKGDSIAVFVNGDGRATVQI